MQAFLDALNRLFGGISTLFTFQGMFVIGIILSIPMTVLFLGEIFNYQFVLRPPWFVRVQRRWNAKALVALAMTAALSIVLQAAGAPGVLIPGTITFRIDAIVRFPFGAIFGMPAVWGVMVANIIGDAIAGTLGPGSVAGFVISWWEAYLFYRFFTRADDYSMKRAGSWVKYYLVAFLWCILGAYYLCTNFKYLILLPDEVIWTGVFSAVIVTTFIGGLLGPVVARIVGPAAQRYGLSREEMGYEKPVPGAAASG
jgi:energy-coupling factor transport system substrate-specific component